jgi:hypothetical protein
MEWGNGRGGEERSREEKSMVAVRRCWTGFIQAYGVEKRPYGLIVLLYHLSLTFV